MAEERGMTETKEDIQDYKMMSIPARVMNALGIPSPEAFLPTIPQILDDIGLPTPEDLALNIKENIRAKLRRR